MGVGPDVVVAWNDGTGMFAERTVLPRAGEARVYSLSAADVDGDGDLDLYDTRYFRAGGYGAQAPTPYHDAVNGAPNVFWRNLLADGEGPAPRSFRDDTQAAGLDAENDRFSMVSLFDDLDGDGRLDLYVANDFGRNNLYLGREGGFAPAPAGPLTDKAAGMGLSLGDADLDGAVDLMVSNMYSAAGGRVTRDRRFMAGSKEALRQEFVRHARGNSIFKGLGAGRFEDRSTMTGAAPGGWAWGARFVDWDRDGLPEMVVPNGFLSGREGPDLQSFFWRRVVGSSPASSDAAPEVLDRYLGAWSVISNLSQFGRQDWNARERTFAYQNLGGMRFRDVSLASGLGVADDGRSLAVADLDQDGMLDLVFRNRTAPVLRVFRGVGDGGLGVSFRLQQPGSNRDAIGAAVAVTVNGVRREARVLAGDGFLGSSPPEVFQGLGSEPSVTSLEVTWPDGEVEGFAVEGDGGQEEDDAWALPGAAWTLIRGTGAPRLRYRHAPAGSALAESISGPLPEPPPAPIVGGEPGPPRVRVPLLAEFPLGAWRLPSFASTPARADSLAGERGLLVTLWASTDPGSMQAVTGAAALDIASHAISLDGVRDSDSALAAAMDLGLGESAGRADAATRLVLDLVLGRTLAPFDDLPLPIGMLLDGEGDLACLYVGALPADVIEEDAARLAARVDPASTLALTGGSWMRSSPQRRLGTLAEGLRARGFNELADHLESR
jgi:hypothetical protein